MTLTRVHHRLFVLLLLTAAAAAAAGYRSTLDLPPVREGGFIAPGSAASCPPHHLTGRRPYNVLVYNRVPKCGSTTMNDLLEDLEKLGNPFRVLRASHITYSPEDQMTPDKFWMVHQERGSSPGFVHALAKKVGFKRDLDTPVIYDMHMRWINFTAYGYPQPTYINIVRDPTHQLISLWNYRLSGPRDPWQKQVLRNKFGRFDTLDDCMVPAIRAAVGSEAEWDLIKDIEMTGAMTTEQELIFARLGSKLRDEPPECLTMDMPEVVNMLTMFFCGYGNECGNDSGLTWESRAELAADRLEAEYVLVGLTEDLDNFLRVMQKLFPVTFAGAEKFYKTMGSQHHEGSTDALPADADKAQAGEIHDKQTKYDMPSGVVWHTIRAIQEPDHRVYQRAKDVFEAKMQACLGAQEEEAQ